MQRSKQMLIRLLALILIPLGARPLIADSQASDWVAPPREARKTNPLPNDEATIAKGKAVFLAQCISCHGETGVGNGPAAKDLAKHPGDLTSPGVQDQPDGAIFWKISTGRAPMTAFQGTLSAEERWQVIRYVRTFAKGSISVSSPTIDAPESLRSSLSALFDAYDVYRSALLKADDKALAAAFPGIQSAVERMHKVVITDGPPQISSAWKESVEALSSAVDVLGKSAKLTERRAEFQRVSTKAESAWQQFGHTRKDPLFVFQTADGATWIQADRPPGNPYGQAKDAAEAKLTKLLGAVRPADPNSKKGITQEAR
jgi:mono/diheme cytochrome c family protein